MLKSPEEEKDSAAAGARTRRSPVPWPRAHPQYEEAKDSDGDDDQTHKSYPRENYEDDELAEEFKKYAKGRGIINSETSSNSSPSGRR